MKALFKCQVCGYVHEGEAPPANCPKCGAPAEKFTRLDDDAAQKIYDSDRTNDIEMEIIALASRISVLCAEGLEIGLDPACIDAFRKARDESWVIKQRFKAELATHMNKGKW
ncbi:MAG: rubredoxin-like domain-containing protein [Christensenellales bacterium]|jgi:rubredoxin